MNRNNSNTADRMERVDGGQAGDVGRGSRFAVCGFFVLAWLMAFSIGVAYPQETLETTVVGQNDPTVDVQAVQDAVDNYEIVNLVGTFHFGDETTPYTSTQPRGGITITRAGLTLRGEGKDATRIVGGGDPLAHRPFPIAVYVAGANAVKIHDLTLDGPLCIAIEVEGSQDFESIGVSIINGVLADVGAAHPYRYGWDFTEVTGDVLIKDCEYRSVGATDHWEDAICTVYGGGDTNFSIINNTLEVGSRVSPVWGNDAIQVGTTKDVPGGHTVRIEGNTLMAGVGVYVHRIRGAEIRNNHITATLFGLRLATHQESQPYIVEKNSIHMEDGSAAIQCGEDWTSPWATDMTVQENTLSGDAEFAFLAEGLSRGNEFSIDANDMVDFTATTAHVSLGADTRCNLFRLYDTEGLVLVDEGTNNVFAYPAHVASASMTPSVAAAGRPAPLEASVVLDVPLHATDRMMLDLSALGIVSELPLEDVGEGRYTLTAAVTPLATGPRCLVPVIVETAQAARQAATGFFLDVYPGGDLTIYEDGPGKSWTVEVRAGTSDAASTAFVYSGSCAHAVGPGGCVIQYVCQTAEGIDVFGYTHLEFWINGGEGSGQDPTIAGKRLSSLGIAPEANTWTKVSIPASELTDPLTSVGISGRVEDTFYIDDMKLVAAELPVPSAVEALEEKAVPSGYALSQNYPNPFNPQTAIRYALPEAGEVRLSVYNVVGQRIRTLVHGYHSVGPYSVIWDGKSDSGQAIGSGIYVYRLEAEGRTVHIRRMVLIR